MMWDRSVFNRTIRWIVTLVVPLDAHLTLPSFPYHATTTFGQANDISFGDPRNMSIDMMGCGGFKIIWVILLKRSHNLWSVYIYICSISLNIHLNKKKKKLRQMRKWSKLYFWTCLRIFETILLETFKYKLYFQTYFWSWALQVEHHEIDGCRCFFFLFFLSLL